jgi:hypothetical protein
MSLAGPKTVLSQKHDLGLQPGGKSPRPLATWFDDIRVEPLNASNLPR